MQDHLGDEFDGVIANVTGFGFFVRLNELNIDGLVHVSNLANDYYQYDTIGQRLIGESSGQIYRLGDSVKVKVAAINLNDRQIDFDLVGSKRKVRGEGKTAKNRDKKQRMRKAEGLKRQSLKVYRVEDGTADVNPAKQEQQQAEKKKNRRSTRQKLKQGAIPKFEDDKAPKGRGKGGKKKASTDTKAKAKPSTAARKRKSSVLVKRNEQQRRNNP
ncbi:S1 RNA-binding domain-containing protein [Photobacterium damselae subsp. piscicida]|nr:S1 RNA-binding domain-containing protein [Photobacterium damselae subsp. piscicida]